MAKLLFVKCTQHPNCTQKLTFVNFEDGTFDMAMDSKPTSQYAQSQAEVAFGDVYCVEVVHITGELDISVG